MVHLFNIDSHSRIVLIYFIYSFKQRGRAAAQGPGALSLGPADPPPPPPAAVHPAEQQQAAGPQYREPAQEERFTGVLR